MSETLEYNSKRTKVYKQISAVLCIFMYNKYFFNILIHQVWSGIRARLIIGIIILWSIFRQTLYAYLRQKPK